MSTDNHSKRSDRERLGNSIIGDCDDLFQDGNKSTEEKSISIEAQVDSCLVLEEVNSAIVSKSRIEDGKLIIPLNPFRRIGNHKKHTTNYTQKNRKNKKQLPYINMVVDSGATRHCCNNLELMKNISNVNVNIMVGNGDIIKATKMGDIGFIKDVLYLPEINHFLFSLSFFLSQTTTIKNNIAITFKEAYCEIKSGNTVIARGMVNEKNLYIMRLSTEFTVDERNYHDAYIIDSTNAKKQNKQKNTSKNMAYI